MRGYGTLLARASLLILLLALPGAWGCAGVPPIVAAPNACASLLPKAWRTPVVGAPIPLTDTAGEWIAFGDAQTGQLDKANDRTVSSIEIVERCEALHREAIAKAVRPWWKFW